MPRTINDPASPPLGDAHNFGRRVSVGPSGRIEKPRCIEWERLFLGDSLLRSELVRLFRSNDASNPFELFPTLSFARDAEMDFAGTVERLAWRPAFPALTEALCAQIGAVVGLTSWFGMGDLHRQNVAFGSLEDGRPVCAPLDIECLLVDHQLPAQSRLIGYHDAKGKGCGLAAFQERIEEAGRPGILVAAVLHGYIGAIVTLSGHEREVAASIVSEPGISRWPIRVILRDTAEYASILAGAAPAEGSPALLPSERAQLARGDVPYYYREAASQEKRWLTRDSRNWPEASSEAALDLAAFPALGIMRALGPDGRVEWRNKDLLLGAGALQLARMLTGKERGDASHAAATLSVSDERIAVSWGEDRRHRWACAL